MASQLPYAPPSFAVQDPGTAPPWLRKGTAPQPNYDTMSQNNTAGAPMSAPNVQGAPASQPPQAPTYQNPPPPPQEAPYDMRDTTGHTFATFYADQQQQLAQQYAAARAAGDPNAMANWRAGLDALKAPASSRGGGGEIPPPNLNDNSKPGGALYQGPGDGFGGPMPPPSAPGAPVNPPGKNGSPLLDPNLNSHTGGPNVVSDPAMGPQTDTMEPGDLFKPGGMGGLPSINTDFSGQAQAGADAAYRGATQFLDKDFATARSALETQLTNQGLQPGSEAWNNAISMMERNQNATRQNAAFQAQGVGHQQAGDLLMRALQSRGQLFNEGATLRGQDLQRYGIDQSTSLGRYNTDTSAELARRRLGLDSNSQDFNQLIQLIAASRGGVNMPNFGNPAPLDVTGANSIASSNANAQANRDAQNRAILAQLGGSVLGGIDWGSLFG